MDYTTIKRRKFIGLLSAPFLVRKASAYGLDPAQKGVLRYQGWAGTVLAAELAEALGYLGPLKLQWVGNTASGPVDLQAATTGDTEFASAFNGPIMKMIGAGAQVKAVYAYGGAAPNECTGILVRNDSPIKTARDLIGRSIAINTLRAQQECFVDQYLLAAGLSQEEIEQVTLVAVPLLSWKQPSGISASMQRCYQRFSVIQHWRAGRCASSAPILHCTALLIWTASYCATATFETTRTMLPFLYRQARAQFTGHKQTRALK
ncbi:ABC transporter substrate-binding protein [Neokomagataea tanensis]|nr:ABC transporter substrate-binding protein [Neokomagataea tanensis]